MNLRSDKYSRQVTLLCPTCGNDRFAHDDADAQTSEVLTCAGCGLEISKDDLIRANTENVDEHVKIHSTLGDCYFEELTVEGVC